MIAIPNNIEGTFYNVRFTDFLKNAKNIRETWAREANRVLDGTFVRVTEQEAARLLKEEVRQTIEEKIEKSTKFAVTKFPSPLANRLKSLGDEILAGRTRSYMEMPKTVVAAAMPPCIRSLDKALSSKKHLSHMGRFTLTSFLLNIGVSPDDLMKMFKEASDFSERTTRYQVEHIGGLKGVKTRYTPPKCETLKTHGICLEPDDLCRLVHHPLSYYRRKLNRR